MDGNQHLYELVGTEIRHHFEDSETSKLAHWYAASVYEKRHRLIVGTASFLAIILTWLLTSPLDKILPTELITYITDAVPMLLGLIVSILSGIGTFLNFSDLAIKHRTAAENYHALWKKCLHWKTDFPNLSDAQEAAKKARLYRERIIEINGSSPPIPKWAWKGVDSQKEEGSTTYDLDGKEC